MAKRRTASESTEGPSFEQSLEELESIISRVESGDVGLEKSIDEYERGVALIKRCRAVLERAEQRIQQLSLEELEAGSGSSPTDAPDDEGGDEESPF